MYRKELKDEFIRKLGQNLEGYTYNKGLEGFVSKNNEGWYLYQIIFLERDYGWELNPCMLIRKNEVENIYHTTSGFEKQYQSKTPTIGTSIEDHQQDGKNYRVDLREENQIDPAVTFLKKIFDQIVLPFFEQYSSIEKMDQLLNGENGKAYSGDIFVGSKGLITAKLTNRNDYNVLQKKYRKHYEHFSDGFYLPEFKQLVEHLN